MNNYRKTNEIFSFNKTQKTEFDIEVEKYEKILVDKILMKIKNNKSFIEKDNNGKFTIKFEDFYITLSNELRISIRNRHKIEYNNHLDYKFFNNENYNIILYAIKDKQRNEIELHRKNEFDVLKSLLDNN